jgi:hypothetical protein
VSCCVHEFHSESFWTRAFLRVFHSGEFSLSQSLYDVNKDSPLFSLYQLHYCLGIAILTLLTAPRAPGRFPESSKDSSLPEDHSVHSSCSPRTKKDKSHHGEERSYTISTKDSEESCTGSSRQWGDSDNLINYATSRLLSRPADDVI